jgi:hypothetical protein
VDNFRKTLRILGQTLKAEEEEKRRNEQALQQTRQHERKEKQDVERQLKEELQDAADICKGILTSVNTEIWNNEAKITEEDLFDAFSYGFLRITLVNHGVNYHQITITIPKSKIMRLSGGNDQILLEASLDKPDFWEQLQAMIVTMIRNGSTIKTFTDKPAYDQDSAIAW